MTSFAGNGVARSAALSVYPTAGMRPIAVAIKAAILKFFILAPYSCMLVVSGMIMHRDAEQGR
jgi:hypothetical protein